VLAAAVGKGQTSAQKSTRAHVLLKAPGPSRNARPEPGARLPPAASPAHPQTDIARIAKEPALLRQIRRDRIVRDQCAACTSASCGRPIVDTLSPAGASRALVERACQHKPRPY
jgi:hypothetical protein